MPFDGKRDPKAAEAFLNAITSPGAEPAFIHCAGSTRAATMWLIKRVAVDHWDVERATQEATPSARRARPSVNSPSSTRRPHPR